MSRKTQEHPQAKGQRGRRHVLAIAAVILAVAGLAACSPAPSPTDQETSIRSATAAALPDLPADQFKITDFVRGPAKSSWKVSVAGKQYACDADELLRLPACKAAA